MEVHPPEFSIEDEACSAVRAYGEARMRRLARKVVLRLRRTEASGVYGPDSGHRTLWDEFCRYVQADSVPLLQFAFEETVLLFCLAVAKSVGQEEQRLLGVYICVSTDDGTVPSVDPYDLARELRRLVGGLAADWAFGSAGER